MTNTNKGLRFARSKRQAAHFETLLGLLKILAFTRATDPAQPPYWVAAAERAIAIGEAIMADLPDPASDEAEPSGVHILLVLAESRVRALIAEVVRTDRKPSLRVETADIRRACRAVAATTKLDHVLSAIEFEAAMQAIRQVEART